MRLNPTWPLAASHLSWLGIFFILPLASMVWLSFLAPQGLSFTTEPSLANYASMLREPYPSVILVSFGFAATTVGCCLLLAVPLALAIAQAPPRWRHLLLLAACLPFWVSTLIRIFALQQILGRRGLINESLAWIWNGISNIIALPQFEPLQLLHSGTGVLIGLVYAYIPFGLLPIYAVLTRIDWQLVEASRDLGASYWYTVRRVLLPLASSGLIAAAILIFVPALGAFYVTEMLGGPNNTLLGNLVELNFKEANNWPLGAALSIGMLALTAVAFALLNQYRHPSFFRQ